MSYSRLSSPSSVISQKSDKDQNQSTRTTPLMEAEVSAAVNFLCDLLLKVLPDTDGVERFRACLKAILLRRYFDHWYPRHPLRGSAYRCLRINGTLDPLVAKAATLSSIPVDLVRSAFPAELSLWVDPGEVSVRFGEDGSVGVIYSCDPVMPVEEEFEERTPPTVASPELGTSPFHRQVAHQQQQLHVAHHRQMQQYAFEQLVQQPPPRETRFLRDVHVVSASESDYHNWNWSPTDFSAKHHQQQQLQSPHQQYVNSREFVRITPSTQYHHVPSPPSAQLSSYHMRESPNFGADATNAQLNRHCRALAEQLVLNGGMLWSANNCGDGAQVMETVVN